MGVLQRLKKAARREPEIVFLGAGGSKTVSSSQEEQRAFAEQVCRHMGDRLQMFIPQVTAKGPVMAIVGEKAGYMAGPGEGKTLVYNDDGRTLLTEIAGLEYPGWN